MRARLPTSSFSCITPPPCGPWRGDAPFLEVKGAAIRHYGYSRDEFSRMTILDIRLPEEVPPVVDHGQRSYAAPGHSACRLPDRWRHRTRTARSSMSTSCGAQSFFGGAKLASPQPMTSPSGHGVRWRSESPTRGSSTRAGADVRFGSGQCVVASGGCRARAGRDGIAGPRGAPAPGPAGWPDGGSGTSRLAQCNGPRRWSLHGLAPGSFPGTYEAFLDIIHADDRAGSGKRWPMRGVWDCLSGGISHSFGQTPVFIGCWVRAGYSIMRPASRSACSVWVWR